MEPTPSFPDVPQLLAQMLAHRGRVVRQIAGAPVAAMNAALAQPQPRLASPPPVFATAPAEPGLRRWLDAAAEQSFVLRGLYEALVPWGREKVQRRKEEEQAQQREQSLVEQVKEAHVRSAMEVTPEDIAFLDQSDRALLSGLVKRGYLKAMPHHKNVTALELPRGPTAFPLHGTAGHVRLVGDRLGNYYDALPFDSKNQKDLADQLQKGVVPGPLADGAHQVYTRWYILLHEAAHCDFRHFRAPFEPTPGTLPQAQCDAINRWLTGSARVTSSDAATLLNENHSDVLSSMLLLEATNHDPKAYQALEARLAERQQTREEGERYTLTSLSRGAALGGQFACVHSTDWAMRRALDRVEEWKGKPPEEVRALARRYASDGLLDLISPTRTLDGKGVGAILAANMLPPEPQQSALMGHLMDMVLAYAHGGDPLGWLKEQADHPVAEVLTHAWETALPSLRKTLSQPLPNHPDVTMTLGEACRRFDARGFAPIHRTMEEATTAALALSDPKVQRMLEAFSADYPLLQKALGLEPSPATQWSVEQWRSARAPAASPQLPLDPQSKPRPVLSR